MDLTQLMVWRPKVDALNTKLLCTVLISKNFKVVDIHFTGIGLKSIWVTQFKIRREKGYMKRSLLFIPWLDIHTGEYTCHLVIKYKNNSITTMNKTLTMDGKYSVLCVNHMNIRMYLKNSLEGENFYGFVDFH